MYKNSSKIKSDDCKYHMCGKLLPNEINTTHLGIQRNTSNSADIENKINLGRRAAYSLMGAGLHCGNGLKQDICARLWNSEIVPRLTFGLEVMNLKNKDINVLEAFQRKSLKQIQGLPDKAPKYSSFSSTKESHLLK